MASTSLASGNYQGLQVHQSTNLGLGGENAYKPGGSTPVLQLQVPSSDTVTYPLVTMGKQGQISTIDEDYNPIAGSKAESCFLCIVGNEYIEAAHHYALPRDYWRQPKFVDNISRGGNLFIEGSINGVLSNPPYYSSILPEIVDARSEMANMDGSFSAIQAARFPMYGVVRTFPMVLPFGESEWKLPSCPYGNTAGEAGTSPGGGILASTTIDMEWSSIDFYFSDSPEVEEHSNDVLANFGPDGKRNPAWETYPPETDVFGQSQTAFYDTPPVPAVVPPGGGPRWGVAGAPPNDYGLYNARNMSGGVTDFFCSKHPKPVHNKAMVLNALALFTRPMMWTLENLEERTFDTPPGTSALFPNLQIVLPDATGQEMPAWNLQSAIEILLGPISDGSKTVFELSKQSKKPPRAKKNPMAFSFGQMNEKISSEEPPTNVYDPVDPGNRDSSTALAWGDHVSVDFTIHVKTLCGSDTEPDPVSGQPRITTPRFFGGVDYNNNTKIVYSQNVVIVDSRGCTLGQFIQPKLESHGQGGYTYLGNIAALTETRYATYGSTKDGTIPQSGWGDTPSIAGFPNNNGVPLGSLSRNASNIAPNGQVGMPWTLFGNYMQTIPFGVDFIPNFSLPNNDGSNPPTDSVEFLNVPFPPGPTLPNPLESYIVPFEHRINPLMPCVIAPRTPCDVLANANLPTKTTSPLSTNHSILKFRLTVRVGDMDADSITSGGPQYSILLLSASYTADIDHLIP